MEPMETDDDPALNRASMSWDLRIPPPALIGFSTLLAHASFTHCITIGKSGAPESPPPPNSASGEAAVPKIPCQSILSGSFPQGMVFDTHNASHDGCFAIFTAAETGSNALNFGTSGIFSFPAME